MPTIRQNQPSTPQRAMHLLEVSLPEFLQSAGTEHVSVVATLWNDSANTHLVLFTNMDGDQIAVLPVGPEQEYKNLEDAARLEFEGLHARLFMRSRMGELFEHQKELAQLEQELKLREAYIAECEQRVASVSAALLEREAAVEHREQHLEEKERQFFRRSGDVAKAQPEPAQRSLRAASR